MFRHKALATSVAAALVLAACGGSDDSSDSSDDGANTESAETTADSATETDGDGSWSIPDEDPEAEITFVGINDPVQANINGMIERFEEEHPTITVNYEYVPFDDLNTVLDARITTKEGDPDLFYVDQPRIASYASRGYVEDITAQFSEFDDLFFESAIEANTYDDKLYAVAMGNSTTVLFYNTDLLEAAGVTPPAPGDRYTWEQLKADAQAAKDAGADYGLLLSQPDRYYQIQPMPESLGGGSGLTGEGNLTPALDNPEWVDAMTFYQGLFTDGVVPVDLSSEQTDSSFAAGNAAFLVATTDVVGVLQDSDINWGASLQPTFEGAEAYSGTGGFSVGINPFSENKEAAAIFLQWLLVDGEDGVTGYAKNRPGGVLPPQREALDFYLSQPEFTSESGAQVAEVIEAQTDTALPRPVTVGFVEFEEITGRMFSDISTGTDPQTALQTADDELTTAFAKYQ